MDAVTSSAVPPAAPKDGAVMTDLMALYQSFFMILASEVGDKTFLIAAILSMRHSRLIVFLGSFSSLVVMSVLSAGMGQLLPSLFLPPKWTHLGASVLFLSFGVKMGKEGYEMEAGNAKVQEEMKEVEQEIKEGEEEHEPIPMRDIETGAPQSSKLTDNPEGHVTLDPEGTPSKPRRELKSRVKEGAHNFASLFLGPVFVQAFILTFLGEWGDRSQIATIALAAAHNIYVVTLGTVLGHSICTTVAVLGGRWISTQISIKHVTLGGALLFILFGLFYLHEFWLGV